MEPSPEGIDDPEYTRYAWIRSIRHSKSITFCGCTDGMAEFQVTIKSDAEIDGDLKVGACLLLYGEDSTTPRGSYEFVAAKVHVIGMSDDEFPIQPKEHSDDFLRTIPELRGRSMKYAKRWRVRSLAARAIHEFFEDRQYHQYFTPIITQADCEGAGETFSVSSDWMKESLTVSGQLHLEVGMMSLGSVYTFSPCFRAERSSTRKHLSEFWMIEAEKVFIAKGLDHMMDLAEGLVKHVIISISSLEQDSGKFILEKSGSHWTEKRWPRITYDKVCEEFGIEHGSDIGSEAEKMVTDKYGPACITHYTKGLKPLYMLKEERHARCVDLIMPNVGERVGGSEREYRFDELKKSMLETGMDMSKMQWYLNTRRWGTVPHAGFGLGFERLLMYLTDAEKVHDVIPFPISY